MLASAYSFNGFWTLNSGYGLKNMMSFMFFTAATAVCWIQACHQWQTHVSYLPDPLWMNSRVYQMIYSSVSPSWPAQQHRGLMYICSISFIIINISYTIIPEMKYGYSHHPTCYTCQYTETHVCTYERITLELCIAATWSWKKALQHQLLCFLKEAALSHVCC